MILKMRDYLTCTVKKIDWLRKKHDSEGGESLLVRVAATHAGILNANNRFYRPDRMQSSVPTWFPKGGFHKPVLIGHDEHGPAIGRVIEAKYVDESYKYASEFPTLKDSIFYSRDAKKVGLFESVDWIVDNLMDLDDYTGLGYIELGMKVTDPEAIEKVLRDEYLTVSVGFGTDAGFCSVCHQDWSKDDKCEHRPGKMYDGKKAFLISGNFYYDEVSFVNFPADPFAGTVSKKTLTDSREKIFFLGLPSVDRNRLVSTGLKLTDSLYESDIQVEVDMDLANNDISKAETQTELVTEMKSDALTSERAQEIKNALSAWQPETDEDKTKKRSLVSTLNAQVRKRGLDKKETPVKSDEDLKELEAALQTDADCCKDDEAEDWSTVTLSEEDKQFFADEDGLYAELEAEMDAAKAEGELTDEQIKDAKLSSEQRKGLKSSTFCGPGRSFPVPDCAHVTAARRLIGRAKVSESTKSKILACVSRKASSMSCGGKKDAVVEGNTNRIEKIISKLNIADGYAKDALGYINKLDAAYDKAEPATQNMMRNAVGAMIGDWDADGFLAYMKQQLEEERDFAVIAKAELAEKEEAINSLTDEKAALEKKVSDSEETSKSLLKVYKRGLAQQIVICRTLKGSDGYKDLTIEQRNAKIDDLAKRHIEYLKDTVADIISELKWDSTTAIRTEKVEEPGRSVSDHVQVDETTVIVPDAEKLQDEKPADTPAQRHQKVREMLMYMTPMERRIALASIGYKDSDSAKDKK
jgi:hypothetical protein